MEEYYTVNQAALVLKVHPLTIRRYIKEGRLKAVKVGGNVRITINDIRAFIQDFIVGTPTSKNKTITISKQFSFDDPFFQLRARGFSLNKTG